MDIQKTVREIGLFETAINLAAVCHSEDIQHMVGAAMPLPDKEISEHIKEIAEWLIGFQKKKYLFLNPEIALVEAMTDITDDIEIIFAIPCDMDEDVKERLVQNIPKKANATVLEEPFFPKVFFPGNGMIVASGYSACDRSMVLVDTYRMLEHYSGFLGKKVFIPFVELDTAARYDGWLEVDPRKVSIKWRVV